MSCGGAHDIVAVDFLLLQLGEDISLKLSGWTVTLLIKIEVEGDDVNPIPKLFLQLHELRE